MSKALLTGKDFRTLISAVTKLPSAGAFANSEMLNLRVADGMCSASSFGIVLSVSRVPARGVFPLVSIDERILQPFSQLASDDAKVLLDDSSREVTIRMSGHREVSVPLQAGVLHEFPDTSGDGFKIEASSAKKISYLSELAFSSASRPELNAVYLAGDGRAIAANPNVLCVFRYAKHKISPIALPIPLARIMGDDYTIFTSQETVLKNGMSAYAMPSPDKAQKEFPIDNINLFEKANKEKLCDVPGQTLVPLLKECAQCLGGLSQTEAKLTLELTSKGIQLTSQNGGAKYKGSILCTVEREVTVQVPMEQVVKSLPFLESEARIQIQRIESGETFFILQDGWQMFPSWGDRKKKK